MAALAVAREAPDPLAFLEASSCKLTIVSLGMKSLDGFYAAAVTYLAANSHTAPAMYECTAQVRDASDEEADSVDCVVRIPLCVLARAIQAGNGSKELTFEHFMLWLIPAGSARQVQRSGKMTVNFQTGMAEFAAC